MEYALYSDVQEDISANIFMNSNNIIALRDNYVYYFKCMMSRSILRIYKRTELKLIFNNQFKLSGIDTRSVRPIKKIVGYEKVLDYLKTNLDKTEYLEFEKLLFEGT